MNRPEEPNRFEDRLLDRMQVVVAANPELSPDLSRSRRSLAPRLALSGAALVAAVAAVAAIAGSGGVTSPAYAVEPEPDGSVSVTINDLSDADGLQNKLEAVGVPAVVSYLEAPESCNAVGSLPPRGGGPSVIQTVHVRSGDEGAPAPPGATYMESHGKGPGLSAVPEGGKQTLPEGGPESATPMDAPPPPPGKQGAQMSSLLRGDGSATFTVTPATIKPGESLAIATSTGEVDSLRVAVVDDLKDAETLPCLAKPPAPPAG